MGHLSAEMEGVGTRLSGKRLRGRHATLFELEASQKKLELK